MEKSFTIRPAHPDDASTLCTLILELATYEKLRHEAHPDPGKLQSHLDPAACPRIEALIAEETSTKKAVGFALFFHNYSTFLTNWGLYLEDLFVRPAYRGQGIGFALFKRVAEIAYERNCERLEWQVLRWNKLAIDFYLKLGATPMEDWVTMRLTRSKLQQLLTHS